MTVSRRLAVLALLLAAPASAQTDPLYDGIDNDGDGQIDEPDESGGAGLQPGGLEADCTATARPDLCLTYFQLNCQRGFPQACQMAALGQNCLGGDPGLCQGYVAILQADSACSFGDPNACAYLRSQGL